MEIIFDDSTQLFNQSRMILYYYESWRKLEYFMKN